MVKYETNTVETYNVDARDGISSCRVRLGTPREGVETMKTNSVRTQGRAEWRGCVWFGRKSPSYLRGIVE